MARRVRDVDVQRAPAVAARRAPAGSGACGRSRAASGTASRGNIFSPQPVSRVPSFSSRSRSALAPRERPALRRGVLPPDALAGDQPDAGREAPGPRAAPRASGSPTAGSARRRRGCRSPRRVPASRRCAPPPTVRRSSRAAPAAPAGSARRAPAPARRWRRSSRRRRRSPRRAPSSAQAATIASVTKSTFSASFFSGMTMESQGSSVSGGMAGVPPAVRRRGAGPQRVWLVGVRGFEPPTPCSRSRCATRLRYTPTPGALLMRRRSGRKADAASGCRAQAGLSRPARRLTRSPGRPPPALPCNRHLCVNRERSYTNKAAVPTPPPFAPAAGAGSDSFSPGSVDRPLTATPGGS